MCATLEGTIRKPSALPLNVYEDKLGAFLRNFCYRDEAAGWRSDKHIRDTGPFVGVFQNGKWVPNYLGTHAPVVTWYSPDMIAWLKANRPEPEAAASKEEPIPDGAIMIKEMYPPPSSHCMNTDVHRLFPMKGAAIMVRAASASYDGWFWGWFGWHDGDSVSDWPATAGNAYPRWDLAFTARTATPRRAPTRPLPPCGTLRANPANRSRFSVRIFFWLTTFRIVSSKREQGSVERPDIVQDAS